MSGAGAAAPAPQVWVDADACPAVVKDILFRAADRAKVAVTLVANQWLRTPPSPWIRSLQVAGGFDVADTAIVERVNPGDLVVTQDIPLAARVLEKGGVAVNPRGDLYTPDNMAERLSMRNFMDELRGCGVQTGGPAAFHARDRQAFANRLDRWLAQRPRT
ncbi:MAG: YaiI/YqxD family protein [Alphaproteobacteria bacterium]